MLDPLPFPSPGDFAKPRTEPVSPASARGFLTTELNIICPVRCRTELDMTEETAAVAAALKLMLALDFFFHVAMPFADYGDKTD